MLCSHSYLYCRKITEEYLWNHCDALVCLVALIPFPPLPHDVLNHNVTPLTHAGFQQATCSISLLFLKAYNNGSFLVLK
jgi:hypothetical protein